MSNNDQLDRIEKMLRARLKGEGHLWWISGYVYGQTSRDDLFIILYPADERLSEKVVRVYPHDFRKLPAFIQTEGIDGGDTEANPNKEQARKKGIYHECPVFEIVTFDGRETQMGKERRFGDVLRVTDKTRSAAPAAPPNQPAPQPRAPQRTPAQADFRQPTPGPLPNDELIIKETSNREFISAVASILETDAATISNRLHALGYKTIPGNPQRRLDAYRRLKASDSKVQS